MTHDDFPGYEPVEQSAHESACAGCAFKKQPVFGSDCASVHCFPEDFSLGHPARELKRIIWVKTGE